MFNSLKSYFCSDEELKKQKTLSSSHLEWPKGEKGLIRINEELELAMVTDLEPVCYFTHGKERILYSKAVTFENTEAVTFYKPVSIPDGFFALGHYNQYTRKQHTGAYILVARPLGDNTPLSLPLRYKLLQIFTVHKLILWEPVPPMGYRALGYVVTTLSTGLTGLVPDLNLVRCVREDLTFDVQVTSHPSSPFTIQANAVPLKQFYNYSKTSHLFNFGCLINSNFQSTMPNLDQVKALIHHYGPRVYFHPDELYLPSSVPWFLKNRAHQDTFVKHGCLETAEVYVYVKPAVGGTFTDFDMWLFFPFKGPHMSTLKLFNFNIEMINKMVGEHVGHWEHFTVRISNLDGHLWMLYFPGLRESGKSGVEASCLEFVEGTNKPIVYSSKFRHTSFPNAGSYIQGRPTKLGIGVMDHVGKSDMFIDASKKYHIIGVEHLGDGVVVEPGWVRELRPEKIPGHLT